MVTVLSEVLCISPDSFLFALGHTIFLERKCRIPAVLLSFPPSMERDSTPDFVSGNLSQENPPTAYVRKLQWEA